MSYTPSPEFDTFIRDFITSHARTLFAAVPPSQDHGGVEPLIFSVYFNLRTDLEREGPLPASKPAIEALPTVMVTEEEECPICLTEYGNRKAKEMPCKHRFHSDCVMKWLGVNGSCPVCRYEMPMDEEEKRRRGGGVGWHVTITVARGGSVSEPGSGLVESNGELVEDMEVDGGSVQGSMEDLD